jgi:hypothetical protein
MPPAPGTCTARLYFKKLAGAGGMAMESDVRAQTSDGGMQRARRMPWAHWQWPSWEHLGRTDGRPGALAVAGWVRDHHRSVRDSSACNSISGACRGAHVIHLLVLRDQSAAGTEGQQGIPRPREPRAG